MKIEIDIEELVSAVADRIIERLGEKKEVDRLLNTDELAKCLGVPKSWVYERTRDRTNSGIPHIKVGKYVRFNLPEVIEWLKEHDYNQ